MRTALMLGIRAGLLALTMAGLGPVQAALFEDDEARRAILDMRQRVDAANNSVKAQAADLTQLRRVLVDMQGQIDALRQDLSKARGTQEQLIRDVSEMQQQQRNVQSSLEDRLRRFEPVTVKVDGQEFQVEPNEKRDYEGAFEAFRKGDFAAAQGALQRFVQRYPRSAYMPSALFWLGNASYATKDYKESLAQFRQMLDLAPAHLRAPEAMLTIANVQLELKDNKGARKTLEDLLKNYPQSEAISAAKDRLAKLR